MIANRLIAKGVGTTWCLGGPGYLMEPELVVLDCHDAMPGATFSVVIIAMNRPRPASLDAARDRTGRIHGVR